MEDLVQKANAALDRQITGVVETKNNIREFWKHITIILATIVGFSSSLISITGYHPNIFLLTSLGLMILALLFGLLLVREDIDYQMHATFKNTVYQYNYYMLQKDVENGNLLSGSEKHAGLILANLIYGFSSPHISKQNLGLNQKAYDLAKKYESQLPLQKYMIKTGRSRYEDIIQKLFIKYTNQIALGFYLVVFLSLALLYAGILVTFLDK